MARYVDSDGINFTKQWEGFRERPYGDFGQMSIGYGHKNDEGYDYVTEPQATSILVDDLNIRTEYFLQSVPYKLNQNQINAVADLTMSVSPYYIDQSQIKEYFNAYFGGRIGKQDLYNWWVEYRDTAGGQPNEYLESRRRSQADLFFKWTETKSILVSFGILGAIVLLMYGFYKMIQ